MDLRTVGCIGSPEIEDASAPFSNFDFIEQRFGPHQVALRRLLSQARVNGYSLLVIEKINSVGISADDDEELLNAKYKLSGDPLIRLSFFKKRKSHLLYSLFKKNKYYPSLVLKKKNLLGYVILKNVPRKDKYKWIIFESIFSANRHPNNFCHLKKQYDLRVGSKVYSLEGNLYCQQNGITNVCAHVALRTVLSAILPEKDISYKKINQILSDSGMPFLVGKGKGLDNLQLTKVLEVLNVNYSMQIFPKGQVAPIPYQRYLYGSIESGQPALLGFFFADPQAGHDQGHILPILGHTFNEDTWVPHADYGYFKIAADIRYIPSETWVSSYLCHDDNFGSNYCLPRQYITESYNQVMVIAIRPSETKYAAVEAEILAGYFLTVVAQLIPTNAQNKWVVRLREAIFTNEGWQGWVVFRPLLITRESYISHLEELEDWKSNRLKPELVNVFRKETRKLYWLLKFLCRDYFQLIGESWAKLFSIQKLKLQIH